MTKSKTETTKPDPRTRRDELLEKAHQEYLIPEAKIILLTMIWKGVNEADVLNLVDLCNAPLHEVSAGLMGLRSAQINLSKGEQKCVLNEEYAQ